ncbi:MAG: alpha-1,2-fucosyltransferase [Lachnospiraceae bacterium]|nr:alpha-1,2-fucosyltransferase [Lachnospiraceae bacterium]
MKIQYFNGGLGNQIFQYIFYRYFQLHSQDVIYLDDMKFFKVHEHNGYELERVFGVKPNLISNYFEPDVWEYMVSVAKGGGGDLCQQMKDMGSDIVMVAETNNFSFDGEVHFVPSNGYHPDIVSLAENIYYFGYWINKNWFLKIRETLMKELVFPPINDKVNLLYAELIEKERCVSVHIRRGDFITLGYNLPEQFYQEAMENMTAALPNAAYLVFSDDIPWCEANFRNLGLDKAKGKLIFITGNEGEKSYIDMDLMSRCQGMILANSSFSYFAALYNNRADRICINPSSIREV